jgi:hypothetical protein
VTPTSTPGRPQSLTAVPTSSASAHTRLPSTDPNSVLPDRDSALVLCSVPVRIYLPDGPVLMELAPPLCDDGASFPDNPRIYGADGWGSDAGDHVALPARAPARFTGMLPWVPIGMDAEAE